jgi:myxalamid-type polyketide synthase MxaE and MxaD
MSRPAPIAIAGIGCRFPGARGPEELWRLLREGRDAVGEVPPSRFDIDRFHDPRPAVPGRICTRMGGFLDGVDLFDPAFFGISPREAARMDPQQRLLLEVAWEALEDAGLVPERLADTPVGVFVGMCYNDYEDLQFGDPASYDIYGVVGGFRSVAAGRVSRALGLRGPSLTVDAACASSLVAVHLACQSLWSGECEVAIACGANLILEPQVSIGFSQARMLAPDGRCKFGDSRANGFVRSEGIGVVVLRRADLARADGDPGYALILGSASNNDGASGASMMTPGREGQEDLLRRAYRQAGVAPAEVGYVEAHGTGTPAGDPVEIGALAAVLGEARPPDRPLLVGSIKTNLGHTEGAAGIAGLIKLALCVEHGEIPASLHVREPNPAIPWWDLPVALQRQLTPWPAGPGPRRGGVSSFGINGSNAHVVVGEAPRPAETTPPRARPVHLLPLSARTPRALAELARSYGALLRRAGAPEPGDIAAAAALRRAHHEHRLAVVGRDAEDLAERLDAFRAGEARAGTTSGAASSQARGKIAFVFPGQGPQWLGMGRELMRHEPVFLAALEACDREIREHAGWSLLEELAAGETESRLGEVDVVQPALFAVQVALAALWRSWGVEPDAVVGQSLGEVAAAHVAGALSLADAARVICRRSRLVKSTRGQGGMAVVELSLEEARAALNGAGGRVAVAVSSAPRSTVLSGEGEALRAVLERLEAAGVFCRPINVDYASHSAQMDPLCEELLRCLEELRPGPARVPFYSTVTGAVADGAELGAEYWARNLRELVLFTESLRRLLEEGHDVFIEVSAHPVLLVSLQQAFQYWGQTGALALPSARREAELPTLLGSLGALYTAGRAVDWRRLHPAGGGRVRLPSYPWQHESLWIERSTPGILPDLAGGTVAGGRRTFESAAHPGLRFREEDLGLRETPWVDGHRVQGALVLPAASILEMALAAGAPAGDGASRAVESVSFEKALFLPEDRPARVQTVVSTESVPPTVRIFSRDEATASWTLHAAGVLRGLGAEAARPVHPPLEAVRRRCSEEVSRERLYGAFEGSGLSYEGSFRGIERLFLGSGEALAELRQPAAGPFLVHPALLDSCFQSLSFLLGGKPGFWPVSAGSLRLYRSPAEGRWCHAVVRARGAEGGEGDVTLLTSRGEPVLCCWGLGFRRLAAGAASSGEEGLHRLEWHPAPPAAPPAHGEGGGWTIIADAGGLGDALAVRLRELGEPCRVVRSLEEPPGARIRGVVDLRGLERTAGDDARAVLDGAVRRCWDATRLLQALAARDGGEPQRLFLVTRGAQPVLAKEAPAPSPACLWGLGRVAAYEHPELRCRLIDLEPEGDLRRDLDALIAEIRAGGSESQVAWRGGGRHAARWTPCPGGERTGRVAVHGDGGYLITGGLGGLGLAVAGWLVERGARHLALLGRRGPSEAAREAIARLEAAGTKVMVLQADLAEAGEAARALEEIGRRMPPLRGVVHAAGLLDDKTLLQLDEERLRAVLRPKVAGAWHLHGLTAGAPLDLFVLFSSVASLLGSPGQGNYAAANAFLDALAHLRRAQGLPAVSINWGPWSDVGLAVAPGRGERLAQRGLGTLAPDQALAALERVLERGDAQVAVVPFDLARWRQFYPAVGDLPLFALLQGPEPPAAAPASAAAAPATTPESLTAYLRDLLARVLGQPATRVDLDRPLTRLGIDSLMAVEVRNRIETDLGVMLSIVSLLRGPTVVQLAEQIRGDLEERGEPVPAAAPASREPSLEAVQGLSEAEVDSLLVDLLAEEEMAP